MSRVREQGIVVNLTFFVNGSVATQWGSVLDIYWVQDSHDFTGKGLLLLNTGITYTWSYIASFRPVFSRLHVTICLTFVSYTSILNYSYFTHVPLMGLILPQVYDHQDITLRIPTPSWYMILLFGFLNIQVLSNDLPINTKNPVPTIPCYTWHIHIVGNNVT